MPSEPYPEETSVWVSDHGVEHAGAQGPYATGAPGPPAARTTVMPESILVALSVSASAVWLGQDCRGCVRVVLRGAKVQRTAG